MSGGDGVLFSCGGAAASVVIEIVAGCSLTPGGADCSACAITIPYIRIIALTRQGIAKNY